ncbi:metalloprotease TldD [Phaeovibrio sulfidiphilus]|uniref:Metalloprotease TldD n=1 Tax=Phaeovibrio sulfidiphilus TaxID=1220600 RepID=A0A8J6YMM5_9PROT|nr:metalloprotease TldD [Phaeovibrio sulfidiphilus]MBE1237265.1 metalloprotease TldD [Phaeovibrio sulfidiphilus]
MTGTLSTDPLFFEREDFDLDTVRSLTAHALDGADDGELFLEQSYSESFAFDDGHLRQAGYDSSGGFGLRAVSGETVGFAQSSLLNRAALSRAADTVRAVRTGAGGARALDPAPRATNAQLYTEDNPLALTPFPVKVALLEKLDAWVRSRDSRVVQVMASLAGSWRAVRIVRADGSGAGDIRPLVRLNVSVVVQDAAGRRETGSFGTGGRILYDSLLEDSTWKYACDEALRAAVLSLEAVDAPAGEMDVVLGPGWPGVLLHEAIGHGLEGDGNRKGTSAFASLIGQRVAAEGVTIVDDGTLLDRRGSLSVDDEGTPTQRTVLIENGILKGYMQDRMNARLMGQVSTGNGRRESYACVPLPRMTNTFMLAGERDPEEIIASVKKGLYAVNFNGGQVDTTSGKFVFSASEAWLIENGKLTAPVKGATLVGNGPDVLTRVSMIGSDLELDRGVGTCGKEGQSVPVGVGQPTLKVDRLTVGGTA